MSLPLESPYPFSLTAIADRTLNGLVEVAFRAGWSPITRLAEAITVSVFKNIKTGHLRVKTLSGVYDFPDEASREGQHCCNGQCPKAEIRIVDDAFWVRLCIMSALGFAEAFMYGDVECDDLISLFRVFLENKDNLEDLGSRFSYIVSPLQKFTSYRFMNTIGNTRSNISAHYDISNDMFAGFLSEDMTYSCAIFPELDGDLHETGGLEWSSKPAERILSVPVSPPPDTEGQNIMLDGPQQPKGLTSPTSHDSPYNPARDPLHIGQMRKLQHIVDKLRIPPPKESKEPVRVLEIGTGWGSMAILLAQQYPHVDIDTLTLSSQQKALAERRIASQGLSHRIRVHLMDYRNMPKEWAGRFARFVSIEMIEAVGKEFLEEYWRVVDWAMEKDGAVGVVQVITLPEARFQKYLREIDFIRKWVVFPGALIPTLTFLISTLSSGSQGRFVADSVSNIGPHYARTLREWRRRFESKFEGIVVPGLRKEFAARTGLDGNNLSRDDIEFFKRKWIYYYCYCEVGFTTRSLGDHIITFMREGNQEYGCNVFA